MPPIPDDLFAWLDECGALAPFRDNGDDAEDAIKSYAAGIRAEVLREVAGVINASKAVLLGARPSSLHDDYYEVSDERLRYLGQQLTTLDITEENPNE